MAASPEASQPRPPPEQVMPCTLGETRAAVEAVAEAVSRLRQLFTAHAPASAAAATASTAAAAGSVATAKPGAGGDGGSTTAGGDDAPAGAGAAAGGASASAPGSPSSLAKTKRGMTRAFKRDAIAHLKALSQAGDVVQASKLGQGCPDESAACPLASMCPHGQLEVQLSAFRALRRLAHHADHTLRACALRTARHLLWGSPCSSESACSAAALVTSRLHLFVARSMEREAKFVWERLQSIKIARRLVEISPSNLPRPIVRALVCVASHGGDKCRIIALETLRVAMVSGATNVVAQCGGVSILVEATVDPSCRACSQPILLSLLHVLNTPDTRQYFRPGLLLQHLLAPYSELGLGEVGMEEEKLPKELLASWEACRAALVTLTRHWAGLALLVSDKHALPSLVLLMHQPLHSDLLFALLHLFGQMLHPPTHSHAHLSVTRRSQDSADGSASASTPSAKQAGLMVIAPPDDSWVTHEFSRNGEHSHADYAADLAESMASDHHHVRLSTRSVLDAYLATLLRALLDAGLGQALTILSTHSQQDVVALGGRLLPESFVASRMGMPVLVQLAAYAIKPELQQAQLPHFLAGGLDGLSASASGSRSDTSMLGVGHRLSNASAPDGVAVVTTPTRDSRRGGGGTGGLLGTGPPSMRGWCGGMGPSASRIRHACDGSVVGKFPGALSGIGTGFASVYGPSPGAGASVHLYPTQWRTRHHHGHGAPPSLAALHSAPLSVKPDAISSATVMGKSMVVDVGVGGMGGRARTGNAMLADGMLGVLQDVKAHSVRASAVIERLAHASLQAVDHAHHHTTEDPEDSKTAGGIGAAVGDAITRTSSDQGAFRTAALLLAQTTRFLPSLADHDVFDAGGESDSSDFVSDEDSDASGDDHYTAARAHVDTASSHRSRLEARRGRRSDSMSTTYSAANSETYDSESGHPALQLRRVPTSGTSGGVSSAGIGAGAGAGAGVAGGVGGTEDGSVGVEEVSGRASAMSSGSGVPGAAASIAAVAASRGAPGDGIDTPPADGEGGESDSGGPASSTSSGNGGAGGGGGDGDGGTGAEAEAEAAARRERPIAGFNALLRMMGLSSSDLAASERDVTAGTSTGTGTGTLHKRPSSSPASRVALLDKLGSLASASSGSIASPLSRAPRTSVLSRTTSTGAGSGAGAGAGETRRRSATVGARSRSKSNLPAFRRPEAATTPAAVVATAPPGTSLGGGFMPPGVMVGTSEVLGHRRPGEWSSSAANGGRSIGSEIRLSKAVSIDMAAFADALKRSNVLAVKDWRLWNWHVVAELLDGPLATSMSHLAEALRTKFIRRLGGFFRAELGSKGCFVKFPWMPPSLRYLRVARQWLLLLLHHRDGVSFLRFDRRGSLIADILMALVRFATVKRSEATSTPAGKMLTRALFERSLARECIALLGVVTSCPAGIAYLNSIVPVASSAGAGASSPLYPGSGPPGGLPAAGFGGSSADAAPDAGLSAVQVVARTMPTATGAEDMIRGLAGLGFKPRYDYLSRQLLLCLDMSASEAARQLLSDWMRSPAASRSLRLFATSSLRAQLRDGAPGFADWGISLLAKQLTDSDSVIRNAALGVLAEACDHKVYLAALIEQNPPLHMCDPELVHPVVLRFMGCDEGVRILLEHHLVGPVLKGWEIKGSTNYVLFLERALLYGVASASAAAIAAAGRSPTPQQPDRAGGVSIPIWAPAGEGCGTMERGWFSLSTLLRLPWRVEVWIHHRPSIDDDGRERTLPDEKIDCDAYLDLSHYRPELGGAPDIRVKAVPLRGGVAKLVTVPPSATLRAALFVGACGVGGDGSVRHGLGTPAACAPPGDAATPWQRRAAVSSSLAWLDGMGIVPDGSSASEVELLEAVLSTRASVGGTDPTSSKYSASCGTAASSLRSAGDVAAATAEGVASSLSKHAKWYTCDADGVFASSDAPGGLTGLRITVPAGGAGSAGAGGAAASPRGEEPAPSPVVHRRSEGTGDVSSVIQAARAPIKSHGVVRGRSRRADTGFKQSFRDTRQRGGSSTEALRRDVRHEGEPVTWAFSSSLMFAGSVKLESLSFHISPLPHRPSSAPVPRHLHGEMSRCEAGRHMLLEADTLHRHFDTAMDSEAAVLERRASLWALGHIGKRDSGANMLLEVIPEVLTSICHLALSADILSLRGTAFHALGLISCSQRGRRALEVLHWSKSRASDAPAIMPPDNGTPVFRVAARSGPFSGSPAYRASCASRRPVDTLDVGCGMCSGSGGTTGELDDVMEGRCQQLLDGISCLANAISAKDGKAAIGRLRKEAPEVFASPTIFLRVHAMLSEYRFGPAQRMMVLSLFDSLGCEDDAWATADAAADAQERS